MQEMLHSGTEPGMVRNVKRIKSVSPKCVEILAVMSRAQKPLTAYEIGYATRNWGGTNLLSHRSIFNTVILQLRFLEERGLIERSSTLRRSAGKGRPALQYSITDVGRQRLAEPRE